MVGGRDGRGGGGGGGEGDVVGDQGDGEAGEEGEVEVDGGWVEEFYLRGHLGRVGVAWYGVEWGRWRWGFWVNWVLGWRAVDRCQEGRGKEWNRRSSRYIASTRIPPRQDAILSTSLPTRSEQKSFGYLYGVG